MDEIEKERNYWRNVAAYLASCHAANYEYDGQLASTSKSRKARFANICDTAAKAMAGHFDKTVRYDGVENAQKRCAEAFEHFRQGGK